MLCIERKTNVTALCKKAVVSRSALSELKAGRTKSLSIEIAGKLATALDITVDCLLGNEETKKGPVYDDEANEMMREMYERPELRALFKTSKKATADDIRAVDQLLKHMAEGQGNDE